MPVVFSELNTVSVTSTMTTLGNRSESAVTYTTIHSTLVNNNISSSNASVKQENSPSTKYIQLQTVRPQGVSSNMPATAASTSSPIQRLGNSVAGPVHVQQQRTTMQSSPAASGMIITRTTTGQYVFVNGTQVTTANAQQTSTQSVVTPPTRVLTTVAVATSGAMTTVTKPASAVSSTPTVVKSEPKPMSTATTTSTISLSQDDMVNVTKCRNFLTTLIKLASSGGQPPETVQNVKALVQNLIDDKISPDEFTRRLQIELNSSPQPYLVPFLEKSLPLLRLTMMQQAPGGQVPVSVAQAAIRVSSIGGDASKGPASPRTKPVIKTQKSSVKVVKNNVPDIRLPRVSSLEPTLKHPSLQTPPPEQPKLVYQQPPHPSVVSGARTLTGSTIRHPVMMTAARGGQRWNAGGTAGGSSYKEDDDINDVASMAGVNLSEESARILATNSDLVGTQTRSCSDVPVLNTAVLQRRMSEIASRNPHIQHIHADAVKLLSCAAEFRIKDILNKLSLVVCHRMVNFKELDHYKAIDDVKLQLKFLQELDQIEKKKHDEAERDILMRAMKSRSKNDNPEHLRLKERAKEMQQQELEKMQIRNADETARNAIGPRRKKARIDSPLAAAGYENHISGTARNPIRSRVKRVNLRDLLFVMEREKEGGKKTSLYKSYLK